MFHFLTLEVVLELHAEGLVRHGGSPGVRDPGLVESALASAMNTYLYANGDIFDIAAAYAFHLAEAQAFLDGNKRVGVSAAVIFMVLNTPMRPWTQADEDEVYDAMIALASHAMSKADLAGLFRRLFS
jgi:death on curing protein